MSRQSEDTSSKLPRSLANRLGPSPGLKGRYSRRYMYMYMCKHMYTCMYKPKIAAPENTYEQSACQFAYA